MNVALKTKQWTADEFVETDQHDFGPLWRYELVDGCIVGHAAPSPRHGVIVSNLATAVTLALRAQGSACQSEVGSAATPKTQQRNTARIPDLTIRCGEHPRVFFEVISPSELRSLRARDLKRRDLQAVEGIEEIVEIFQHEDVCHLYRRNPATDRWTFDFLDDRDAVLRLESVGIDLRLSDIYPAHPSEQETPE